MLTNYMLILSSALLYSPPFLSLLSSFLTHCYHCSWLPHHCSWLSQLYQVFQMDLLQYPLFCLVSHQGSNCFKLYLFLEACKLFIAIFFKWFQTTFLRLYHSVVFEHKGHIGAVEHPC